MGTLDEAVGRVNDALHELVKSGASSQQLGRDHGVLTQLPRPNLDAGARI
jgi:hypothetical protein